MWKQSRILLAAIAVVPSLLMAAAKPEPIALFNGMDLGNWYAIARDIGPVDPYEFFAVEDGILHVYRDQEDGSQQPVAGLITKESYSRYHLTFEYKWGEQKFIPRFARFHRGYCWETPEWNVFEVIVDGPNAVFKVNGRVVNEIIGAEYPCPETGNWIPLTKGKILLQAEGAEIFYRNIVLTPLPEI